MENIEYNQIFLTGIIMQSRISKVNIGEIGGRPGKFVIKTIKPYNQNPEFFERELNNLASLNHPHILKLTGKCYSYNGELVIVAPYLQKGSLMEQILMRKQNGLPFTEEEIWNHMKNLIGALSYMQSNKVCHRDIKPENIFVDIQSRLILGDFGSSLNLQIRAQQDFTIQGTVEFLSPTVYEKHQLQIKNNLRNMRVNHNAYKSDVYSLGLTFLYMCTFYPAKRYFNPLLSKKMIENDITELQYSNNIKDLLRRMVKYQEEERPDFTELRAQIINIQSDPVYQDIHKTFEEYVNTGNRNEATECLTKMLMCPKSYSIKLFASQSGISQVIQKFHQNLNQDEDKLTLKFNVLHKLYKDTGDIQVRYEAMCIFCDEPCNEIFVHCCNYSIHRGCLISRHRNPHPPTHITCSFCKKQPRLRCIICGDYYPRKVANPRQFCCESCIPAQRELLSLCKTQCPKKNCPKKKLYKPEGYLGICSHCPNEPSIVGNKIPYEFCVVCKEIPHFGRKCLQIQRKNNIQDRQIIHDQNQSVYCEKDGLVCIVCLEKIEEMQHSLCKIMLDRVK